MRLRRLTADFGLGGLRYLKRGSAVASEVGINTVRDYTNWGGEFMDDAFRFGEQPLVVSCDKSAEFEKDSEAANLQPKNWPKRDFKEVVSPASPGVRGAGWS
jgi:hypothetical protein